MALTQVDPGLLNSQAQYTGFKNRIINGAMMIDQRNAGASFTPTVGTPAYTLDRWSAYLTSGSGHTVQQVSDAPTGFSNSLKVTVGTGASPSSTQQNILWQPIEGYNCADLGLGTANAATVTVSFWVKCSLSGTFNLWLENGAGTIRAYPTTFTINSTGTWEYKTVTVALDTSAVGTWSKTNGVGLIPGFSLGSGSNFVGTANTWQTGDYKATSGATNVIATSGATFQVTGVQLEKGSTATSFDYRPYGTELALCQRYYVYYNQYSVFIGQRWTTLLVWASVPTPVVMRTTPSAVATGGGALITRADGGQSSSSSTVNTVSTQSAGMPMAIVVFNTSFDPSSNWTFAVYTAGLTLSAEL